MPFSKRAISRRLWIGLLAGAGLCALVGGWMWLQRYRRGGRPGGTPPPPLAVTEVAAPADVFDYPLDPERFGPYVPYVSGPLPVDTRFDVQNPGLGNAGKCFVNRQGERVPFERLWHAGEDWFALDASGKVQGRAAAGEPVRAVANGVVTWAQQLGSEGNVLIVEHHLVEGGAVWSVYWHLDEVAVAVGEAVERSEIVGVVHDRGFNSHLHWEIRTFADAGTLFPPDTAGGRGRCNGYVMGVGYTWDDDPARAHPQSWGYVAPSAFVAERRR